MTSLREHCRAVSMQVPVRTSMNRLNFIVSMLVLQVDMHIKQVLHEKKANVLMYMGACVLSSREKSRIFPLARDYS